MTSNSLRLLGSGVALFFLGMTAGICLRPSAGLKEALVSGRNSNTEIDPLPLNVQSGRTAFEEDAAAKSDADATARAEFRVRVGRTLLIGSATRRQRAFVELLDHMQPGDALAVHRQLAATMDQGILYKPEWEAFWTRWGEIDGPAAIDFILRQNNDAVTKDIRRVMRGWSAQDPASATTWLDAHQETFAEHKQELGDALIGLADGFGSADLTGATRVILQAAPAGDPLLGSLMETLAEQAVRQGRAESVARWFDALPADATPGSARAAAMGHVYWRLYQGSPDRAMDFLREQASQPWRSDKLIGELAGRVAEKDPAKAVGWLETLAPASDGRFPGLAEVVGNWTRRDTGAAQQWLDGLAPGSFRDQAVAAFGEPRGSN